MSTQLVSPPIKARVSGAQEAQTASMELPTQLLPAKSKLDRVLIDYSKAGTDLEESRGHLARAETDKQSALNNLELTDQESSDRVAVAIRNSGIYGARVSNREAARERLLKELKLALSGSHSEYSALVDDVLTQRRGILRVRMIETGHLVGRFGDELEGLLESSQLILDVRSLEIPSQAITYSDSAEQITQMAKRILAGYEAVAVLQRVQI
jgi:hypothetical protein